MNIEPFQTHQAKAVSDLIRRGLLEINSKDYPLEFITYLVDYFSPAQIVENAQVQHIFVALEAGKSDRHQRAGELWQRGKAGLLWRGGIREARVPGTRDRQAIDGRRGGQSEGDWSAQDHRQGCDPRPSDFTKN